MKNPWLSMWLSAANAWSGAARGFWTAEMHRQQTAMMNEMMRQTLAFWSQAWSLPNPDRRTTNRRRR